MLLNTPFLYLVSVDSPITFSGPKDFSGKCHDIRRFSPLATAVSWLVIIPAIDVVDNCQRDGLQEKP